MLRRYYYGVNVTGKKRRKKAGRLLVKYQAETAGLVTIKGISSCLENYAVGKKRTRMER
jgi:hypothetical protein